MDQKKSVRNAPVRFADCYVLCADRRKEFLVAFLDTFIPHNREYVSAYPVPEISDEPSFFLPSAAELLQYLEENKREPYALYWSNRDEDAPVRQAMCLFTSDGQVILGLSVISLFPDDARERSYLQKLKAFSGCEKGLIEYAQPAARETEDFLKRVGKFEV